jgi:hypothetical protein
MKLIEIFGELAWILVFVAPLITLFLAFKLLNTSLLFRLLIGLFLGFLISGVFYFISMVIVSSVGIVGV